MSKYKTFIFFLAVILTLNLFKKENIFYIPFNIPGSQMACTIPPFGIFIEKKYKNEGTGCGTIVSHEKVHWKQYKRMGLVNFYYEYIKNYLKNGRINKHWMEVEARKLSKCKN